MTDERQNWLRDELDRGSNLCREIHSLIDEVLPTLVENSCLGRWHYELPDRPPEYGPNEGPRNSGFTPAGNPLEWYLPRSQSTTAMIGYALAVLGVRFGKHIPLVSVEGFSQDHLSRYRSRPRALTPEEVLWSSVDALAQLINWGRERADADNTKVAVWSETFGAEDPWTLYFALSLLTLFGIRERLSIEDSLGDADTLSVERRESARESRERATSELLNAARQRAEEAGRKFDEPVLSYTLGDEGRRAEAFSHSLPRLYFRRLANLLDTLPDGWADRPDLSPSHTYFLNEFFTQMSFSDLRHAEFDIGQFVFALEGALLGDPKALTDEQVERAISIVRRTQETSPDLRQLRPFRRDTRGGVNVPVSIEVATSLLRVTILLDNDRPSSAAFAIARDIFARFFEWLRSQLVHIRIAGVEYRGWHSEHFHARRPSVNTWQTALVLMFLALYRAALERYLAHTAVRVRRFDLRQGDHHTPHPNWTEFLAEDPMDPREPGDHEGGSGPFRIENRSAYAVYHDIYRSIIRPRIASPSSTDPASMAFSTVIHGPPGTGKTFLAERIADALGWDFMIITPSDFVAGGPSEVEARAKDIFETLMLQANTVIFFDEIDRLILDRGSPEYHQQGDMFQFMTPSMLTKINDLRRAERCVFCIATNYAWRIDPAITRRGRIDRHYLLLPPNLTQRTRIIGRRLEKEARRRHTNEPAKAAELAGLDVGSIARRLCWYTFTDLHAYIDYVLEIWKGSAELLDVLESAREIVPSAGIAGYEQEIRQLSNTEEKLGESGTLPPRLLEEYLMLQWLHLEVDDRTMKEMAGTLAKGIDKEQALAAIRDPELRAHIKERWA